MSGPLSPAQERESELWTAYQESEQYDYDCWVEALLLDEQVTP